MLTYIYAIAVLTSATVAGIVFRSIGLTEWKIPEDSDRLSRAEDQRQWRDYCNLVQMISEPAEKKIELEGLSCQTQRASKAASGPDSSIEFGAS